MHLYDQGGFIPFPPYSRGWSDIEKIVQQWVMIFPVFAGIISAEIPLRNVLMVILLHYDLDYAILVRNPRQLKG